VLLICSQPVEEGDLEVATASLGGAGFVDSTSLTELSFDGKAFTNGIVLLCSLAYEHSAEL